MHPCSRLGHLWAITLQTAPRDARSWECLRPHVCTAGHLVAKNINTEEPYKHDKALYDCSIGLRDEPWTLVSAPEAMSISSPVIALKDCAGSTDTLLIPNSTEKGRTEDKSFTEKKGKELKPHLLQAKHAKQKDSKLLLFPCTFADKEMRVNVWTLGGTAKTAGLELLVRGGGQYLPLWRPFISFTFRILLPFH